MRYRWTDIPILCRTPVGRMEIRSSLNYLAWPVLRKAAILHRRTLGRKIRIVAVVGSFGKTTTARAIVAALGLREHPQIQCNAWSAVARAVLRTRPQESHTVIEVAVAGAGQMALYADMIGPDITVVTSIGSEHHTSFRTPEVTRAEKLKMVQALTSNGIAVLNGDDPNVRWMKGQTNARVVTFGLDAAHDVYATDIALDWPHGTRFKLHAAGQSRDVRMRLVGRHMVYPVLAAAAVAVAEGLRLDRVLPTLEQLQPTPGRLERIRLANGALLLRDDTKSAIETIEAAFDVFSEVPAFRRIAVLGEITEPLGNQPALYRHLGQRIATIASRVIFLGSRKNFRSLSAGATGTGFQRAALTNAKKSVVKTVALLRDDLRPGDVVLTKGRLAQRLERVALGLAGRKVRCDISLCKAQRMMCAHCPMLERGWIGQREAT